MHSKRLILRLAAVTLTFLIISCEKDAEDIYIPGPRFTQTLTVSAAMPENRDLRVGEWLELEATRMTGPWVKVQRTNDNQPDCWWRRPPPEVEEDVQSNVRWHAEPEGSAVFNVPGPLTLRERRVRFTKPGHYRLLATSAGCGEPFSSNVIELTVVPDEGTR